MEMRRLHRLIVGVCLVAAKLSCAAQDMRQVPTTWWPDGEHMLLWTGSGVGGFNLTHMQAESACSQLTLDGNTGWRLPTKAEFLAITTQTQVMNYNTEDTYPNGRKFPSRPVADLNSPAGLVPSYLLAFTYSGWFWTSDIGRVPQDFWVMEYPSNVRGGPTSLNAGTHHDGIQTLCVRPLDPALVDLAKQAHPPSPVSGVAELKSIVPLLQSEAAIKAAQFQEAIDVARQALVIYPNSLRAYEDIANAYGYLGQWEDDVKALETALAIDKKSATVKDDLAAAKSSQKLALKDKNLTVASVLVLKADTALDEKRYQDAADAATQVTQLEPKWYQGYKDLGLAEYAMEQWSAAVSALKVAAKLDKGDADEVFVLQDDMSKAKKKQKSAAKGGA